MQSHGRPLRIGIELCKGLSRNQEVRTCTFSRTATNLLTYLCPRLEWFRFNESAHVMVKQRTLATDLSRRLGLVKSSFQSNPSSFFSWNCGSNLPTYMLVSSQLFVLTAPWNCVIFGIFPLEQDCSQDLVINITIVAYPPNFFSTLIFTHPGVLLFKPPSLGRCASY